MDLILFIALLQCLLLSHKPPRNKILLHLQEIIHHPPVAGDKIDRPLEYNSHLLEMAVIQRTCPSRLDNAASRLHADPRHTKQRIVIRSVDLHRK